MKDGANYIWMRPSMHRTTFSGRLPTIPDYDFNEPAHPYGIGYWLALVEKPSCSFASGDWRNGIPQRK